MTRQKPQPHWVLQGSLFKQLPALTNQDLVSSRAHQKPLPDFSHPHPRHKLTTAQQLTAQWGVTPAWAKLGSGTGGCPLGVALTSEALVNHTQQQAITLLTANVHVLFIYLFFLHWLPSTINDGTLSWRLVKCGSPSPLGSCNEVFLANNTGKKKN